MYLLAFALLFNLPAIDPVILSVHRTHEDCIVAADRTRPKLKKELEEKAASGALLVCLKVMSPT